MCLIGRLPGNPSVNSARDKQQERAASHTMGLLTPACPLHYAWEIHVPIVSLWQQGRVMSGSCSLFPCPFSWCCPEQHREWTFTQKGELSVFSMGENGAHWEEPSWAGLTLADCPITPGFQVCLVSWIFLPPFYWFYLLGAPPLSHFFSSFHGVCGSRWQKLLTCPHQALCIFRLQVQF